MIIRSVLAGRQVYHVTSDRTVRDAARYMSERRVGAVAVVQDERLVGILSERDVMSRVVAKGLDPDRTRVDEVMTRDLLVGGVEESYGDALRKMRLASCRHLPVVDGGHLIGMVSQRDLLQIDVKTKDEEIRLLNVYINGRDEAAPSV
jgi:CBS domain-containing protein